MIRIFLFIFASVVSLLFPRLCLSIQNPPCVIAMVYTLYFQQRVLLSLIGCCRALATSAAGREGSHSRCLPAVSCRWRRPELNRLFPQYQSGCFPTRPQNAPYPQRCILLPHCQTAAFSVSHSTGFLVTNRRRIRLFPSYTFSCRTLRELSAPPTQCL